MRELNTYVEAHYNSWKSYASRMIGIGSVNLEPTEVVNEILSNTIYSANHREKIDLLVGDQTLDFYVKKAIKIVVISPRSSLRYQDKIKRAILSEDIADIRELRAGEIEEDGSKDFDKEASLKILSQQLEELQAPQYAKDIFRWRVIDSKSLVDYPTDLKISAVREAYNCVKTILHAKLLRIQKENSINNKEDE